MVNLLSDNNYSRLGMKGAWSLAYYVPGHQDKTIVSDRLLDFKRNNVSVISKWNRWVSVEFRNLLENGVSFDFVLRALGSSELSAAMNRPLDSVGQTIASICGSKYVPRTISKTHPSSPLHTLNSLEERRIALDNIYQIESQHVNFNFQRVLIIDDVSTTGTTLKSILKTLRNQWGRGSYYYFCLARTIHDPLANKVLNYSYLNDFDGLQAIMGGEL